MIDGNLERLRAHKTNLRRYRRLLATRLSDLERAYIVRRIDQEQRSVEALLRKTVPDLLSLHIDHGRASNLEISRLLHPRDAFVHPMDVVEDCDLTLYEKRAILSSWAADACDVRDVAEPNQPIDGAVGFDDIVDALRTLETGSWEEPEGSNRDRRGFCNQDADDSPAL